MQADYLTADPLLLWSQQVHADWLTLPVDVRLQLDQQMGLTPAADATAAIDACASIAAAIESLDLIANPHDAWVWL